MAPDPSRWRYTGGYRDAGAYGASSCACGHDIRYEFPIERDDGASLVIGSTCIDKYIPVLIAEGAGTLAMELKAANVQFKREMRRNQQERLAEGSLPLLEGDFATLGVWCLSSREALVARGVDPAEIPPALQDAGQLPAPGETAHETASRIRRRHTAIWWAAVEAARDRDGLDLPPTPEDRPLVARLRNAIARNSANPQARLHRTALFAAERYPGLA